MSTPSVLHVGSIAGVPQELARAQRRLGIRSDTISFQPHKFQYPVDIYRPTRTPFPLRCLERTAYLHKAAVDYDVLHFHWSSAVPFGLDLPWWRHGGKRVIIHHHGDDVRGRGVGPLFRRYADRFLVSTPDLLKWSPQAVWMPNPIDLERYPYIGVEEHAGPLRIVHAPSDRSVKGTDHVIRAVRELRRDGYDVELILVENLPFEEAARRYRQADVVVDQLLVGWYGNVSVEAMSLGKPVCVYIRKDLLPHLPDLPLVNVTASTLKQELERLAEDIDLRRSLGSRGRAFVEATHDSDKIARFVSEVVY